MKYMFVILTLLCVVAVGWLYIRTNKNGPGRKYQHYFAHCLKNAADSKMDDDTANKICACVASTIVESSSVSGDLAEEELQAIAAMCLGEVFQKK